MAVKEIKEEKQSLNETETLLSIQEKIATFIKDNKMTNPKALKPLLTKGKELGLTNPSKVDNLEDATALLEFIELV